MPHNLLRTILVALALGAMPALADDAADDAILQLDASCHALHRSLLPAPKGSWEPGWGDVCERAARAGDTIRAAREARIPDMQQFKDLLDQAGH